MDTQTQIDRLIELAIIQRSELKQLVEQLPQLREHLNAEVEKVFDETEPQLRAELEEWTTKQTADKTAALGVALESKIADLAKSLEISTQARYNAIIAEREENARLAAQAEAKIAEHAASLPGAVKEIVSAELARFPRAGEIDQLRKEFAEPKSLNPRGKWQAGETYNKLDLVTINGDSYVSNIDGNTEKPSRSAANWTLNAARGNSGGGGGVTSLTDLVPVPSNGQLLIGNGSAFVNNTLTAGTGVTITNGAGTITIDASGAQEILTATVKNAESVAITRGQVVYLFSATGGFPSVKLAYNTSDATSAKTFGVVSDVSIAPNGTGTITCVGVVSNLNLGAYNDGDTVYLGATPGSFTATKPYAPNHLVYVGIIERANAGNGELYVRIQNGYELDEIHDVQINSPLLAGQTLIYDATTDLWKNARLTAGVGVSISNGDSAITISADGGVNYQGTWNASTNTPTLTSSVGTKGFYYVVSVAGSTNLNGVTDWKVGDWAIFNGTAWEKVDTTDQVSSVFGRTGAVVGVSTDYSAVGITNTAIGASNPSTGAFTTLSASTSLTSPDVTLGTSGPSVKSSLSARAPRQGLVFDGTAGATHSNITLGSGDFTVAVWARVQTTSAANRQLLGSSGGDTALFLDTTGLAKIYISGQTTHTASSVVPDQKSVLIVYTRSGTSGTFYQNAVSNGAVTDSNNYSTAWSYFGARSGGGYTTGSLIPLIYNRALSASEVVSLYEAGAPAGADYNSASNTAINTNTAVDGVAGNNTFAATAGGSFTGASATGFTAVSGGGAYAAASFQPNFTVQPGQIIRVTYTATVNSGTVLASLMNSSVTGISATHTVTTGTRTVEFVATAASTSARVIFGSSGGGACNFSVSSVSVVRAGLLLAPDAAQAGGGLVWYDTSGNAANITLPASGVSWNVPSSRVLGGNWTTSGNLTVSGTGTSSVAGSFGVGGASPVVGFSGNEAAWVVGENRTDGGSGLYPILLTLNDTRAYNSTNPSPGGGLGFTYKYNAAGNYAAGVTIQGFKENTTDGNYAGAMRFLTRANGANPAEAARITSSGNFLIGTTTDSGNGRVQLATHTTSAGGIGFGTDISLFRRDATALKLNSSFDISNGSTGASIVNAIQLNGGGSSGANNNLDAIQWGGGGLAWLRIYGIRDAGGGFGGTQYFQTMNGSGTLTTALTLDSSQNAAFAGVVVVGGGNASSGTLAVNYSSAVREPIAIVNSAVGGKYWYIGDGTGTSNGIFGIRSGSDAKTVFTITGAGNATFAGTISPQQAATASAPTYVKGAIYFDTTLNKLRVGGATGWETITSV